MKRFFHIAFVIAGMGYAADVTPERLRQAQSEDATWLMYGKNYSGWRYSELKQINAANVKDLAPQWTFQTGVAGRNETTPLVFDGMMYLTAPTNHAWALDLATGRPIWHYAKPLRPGVDLCCGQVNRGFAALGNKLFKVNLDAKLVALDSKTGSVLWETEIDDVKKGYSATVAPLIVKNLVVVGVAGAEYGIRGFIDAYDADTGKRVWRFWTVAAPGEPGGDTWGKDASWQRGGGSTWVTGTYDPETNLIYWGTGNPGPDYNGDDRPGDNLYACAVVAIDADTHTSARSFETALLAAGGVLTLVLQHGGLFDLIPGASDIFIRRFIAGVHLAALYLAGKGMRVFGTVREVSKATKLLAAAEDSGVTVELAELVRVAAARQRNPVAAVGQPPRHLDPALGAPHLVAVLGKRVQHRERPRIVYAEDGAGHRGRHLEAEELLANRLGRFQHDPHHRMAGRFQRRELRLMGRIGLGFGESVRQVDINPQRVHLELDVIGQTHQRVHALDAAGERGPTLAGIVGFILLRLEQCQPELHAAHPQTARIRIDFVAVDLAVEVRCRLQHIYR